MAAAAPKDVSKFALSRARKRAQGKRLLRMWVVDPDSPGVRDEAARQAALLRQSPEEVEILTWIEAVQAADGWPE